MNSKKSYDEIKKELDIEIAWFEGDQVTIQEAVGHYKKAKDLLSQMEKILDSTKIEIQKLD